MSLDVGAVHVDRVPPDYALLSKRTRRRLAKRLHKQVLDGRSAGRALSRGEVAADPQCVPFVVGFLREESNPEIRGTLTQTLARIQAPAAQPALVALLQDPTELVRFWAAFGLEKVPTAAAYEPLLRLLETDGTARVAAGALFALGDRRAVGHLRAAAERSRSHRVSTDLRKAAQALSARG